jgi:hypothetical protein
MIKLLDLLKESIQGDKTIILYSIYTLKQYNPIFKEKGFINKKGQGSNGKSTGKDVILCSYQKNGNFEGFNGKLIQVEFKKPLSQIFMDYDDCDYTEFGITSNKNMKGVDNESMNYENQNKPYSITNMVKWGLNFNKKYSWYGIYVTSIKPNEIISISNITN